MHTLAHNKGAHVHKEERNSTCINETNDNAIAHFRFVQDISYRIRRQLKVVPTSCGL